MTSLSLIIWAGLIIITAGLVIHVIRDMKGPTFGDIMREAFLRQEKGDKAM
jgi:hypothetical protein